MMVAAMATVSEYLGALVRLTNQSETEVVARALEAGLRQLWREILARLVRGEITREDAIEAVGIDWVELAERQRDAVVQDVAWALGQ